MVVRSPALGLISVGWALLALVVTAAASENPSAKPREAPARPAVLVELFTSQGCSSCPAADRLLSRLAEVSSSDIAVVPLAFHVDYWNYLGWSDPFSSSDWSDRQRSYARRLESRGVYTPQLVVNGRWDAVGSNEPDVTALIERARRDGEGGWVEIEAHLTADDRIDIGLSARVSPGSPDKLSLWVAVVESGFETPVRSGENARKALRNDYVVRRMLPAFELDANGGGEGSIRVNPDPAWVRRNLSFAAFVQDRATLRVHAAASTRLVD